MKTFFSIIVMLLTVIASFIIGAFIGLAIDVQPLAIGATFSGITFISSFALPSGIALMGFSPQNKISEISRKMGQRNIVKQQGTTRMIWDTLELIAGQVYYRFFEGVNTRAFPFTNLTDNKLEAGETLACQFMYLTLFDKTTPGDIWTIIPIPAEIYMGTLSLELANTTVMKPIPIMSFNPAYNRMPNAASHVFKLYTNQVITPLTNFFVNMHLLQVPAIAHYSFIRLTIEGTGSILSPKGTL